MRPQVIEYLPLDKMIVKTYFILRYAISTSNVHANFIS